MIFDNSKMVIFQVAFVSLMLLSLTFGISGYSSGSDSGGNEIRLLASENDDLNVNATNGSSFAVRDSNFDYNLEYDVVEDGSDNEWIAKNVWKEEVKWTVEPEYNGSSQDVYEFEFGIEYFEKDISDLLDEDVVWSGVLIEVETEEERGYLYSSEFSNSVDYDLLSDSLVITTDDKLERVMVYQNPNTLYRLEVSALE